MQRSRDCRRVAEQIALGAAHRGFENNEQHDRCVPGGTFVSQSPLSPGRSNMAAIKALTYMMFAMFAMTTDSVGIIIPEIVKTFQLSLTAARTLHYATMSEIAA